MKSAVIVPTYNERENIELLVNKILRLRAHVLIIVVDDNSPDGTGLIADKLSKKYKAVKVIHRQAKLGLGTAYVAGFRKAFQLGCDLVISMDADLSHDPVVIPKMLKLAERYDVVIGSRHIKGGKIIGFDAFRHTLSGTAQMLCKYALALSTHDSTSGYRAYRKEVIKKIKFETIKSQGYSFLIEAIYRCHKHHFTIKEVPITFKARSLGASKLSQNEIYKAIGTTYRLLLDRFNINA